MKIGKPNVARLSNASYGIVKKPPVTGQDRSQPLDPEKLARVRDDHSEDVAGL